MSVYSASVSNVTPSTTLDNITITGSAGAFSQLIEVSISGQGTASAANDFGIFFATTLGITPTAFTPTKFNPVGAAALGTAATGWGTQPAMTGAAVISLGVNSNGGIYRWVARPGQEIVFFAAATVSQSQLSLRAKNLASAGPVSAHMIWMEGGM